MSGSETESQKAAGEARRDVLGHVVQPGTGGRYDALLRYLRGLYVREPKSSPKPESPKTDPAKK
jgi:hypothetical protein